MHTHTHTKTQEHSHSVLLQSTFSPVTASMYFSLSLLWHLHSTDPTPQQQCGSHLCLPVHLMGSSSPGRGLTLCGRGLSVFINDWRQSAHINHTHVLKTAVSQSYVCVGVCVCVCVRLQGGCDAQSPLSSMKRGIIEQQHTAIWPCHTHTHKHSCTYTAPLNTYLHSDS